MNPIATAAVATPCISGDRRRDAGRTDHHLAPRLLQRTKPPSRFVPGIAALTRQRLMSADQTIERSCALRHRTRNSVLYGFVRVNLSNARRVLDLGWLIG
jgi:hypothetical protein